MDRKIQKRKWFHLPEFCQQSMKKLTIFLAVLLLSFFILMTAILLASLEMNRSLTNQYIAETAELYVSQINMDITQLNSELVYRIKTDSAIESLPEKFTSSDSIIYPNLRYLMESNRYMHLRYREASGFFVYSAGAQALFKEDGIVFADSTVSKDDLKIIQFLSENVSKHRESTQWTLLKSDGGYFIVSWCGNSKKVNGCVIQVETILNALADTQTGYKIVPYFVSEEGEIIKQRREGTEEDADRYLGEVQNAVRHPEENKNKLKINNIYSYEIGTVGRVFLCIEPNSGFFRPVLILQVITIIIILAFIILFAFASFIYYRRIILPLDNFVREIDNLDEDTYLNDTGSNNLLELREVSSRFKELLRKMQSLKIALYEKELAEQKSELEIALEQTRPHFLLNCLSIIHGMADSHDEEDIVDMTSMMSEYLRYSFQDTRSKRTVADELRHVELYVRIQKIRYGTEAFHYEAIVDNEPIREYYIPQMILQILVENSIVHQGTLDHPVDITLYLTEEELNGEKYLYICESDTGQGFREDILKAIKKDTPIVYNGRRHVGLQNIQRRLKLMYGDRASMTLSNMEQTYGAVIEIRIPAETLSDIEKHSSDAGQTMF
ncbi:MAG: histidine kinase [Lachnospiraceae bacterium]|jgi:sensor histidine kinase YesM|nr:histidine kinase [Lachnospiraceae bacterium]MCH4067755.1 histidine kinase [Lachnospiraceae bacterium]MCH4113779.1 histidine kinase [Lachnospiraceae bacterium]